MIHVSNLTKDYITGSETTKVLRGINLHIKKGEIVCIFGTSGSGKSTFLNQLAGLEKPTTGTIVINGVDITELNETKLASFRQHNLGFIFQSYNLLPNFNAVENVAMPLMFSGMKKEEREKIAKAVLIHVGLEHRLNHYPRQMSGGQQQRVGIARALVNKPSLVFADEPTGNLDTKTTEDIMNMIKTLANKLNMTMILVTHDPDMTRYATRVITLKDGLITNDETLDNKDSKKESEIDKENHNENAS